jgi:hypothetical protein
VIEMKMEDEHASSITENISIYDARQSGVRPVCFKSFVDGCYAVRIASTTLSHIVCFDQILCGDSFVLRGVRTKIA